MKGRTNRVGYTQEAEWYRYTITKIPTPVPAPFSENCGNTFVAFRVFLSIFTSNFPVQKNLCLCAGVQENSVETLLPSLTISFPEDDRGKVIT